MSFCWSNFKQGELVQRFPELGRQYEKKINKKGKTGCPVTWKIWRTLEVSGNFHMSPENFHFQLIFCFWTDI